MTSLICVLICITRSMMPERVWNGIASPTLSAPFPPAAIIFLGNNHRGPLPCSHSQGSLSPIQIMAHSKDRRAPGNATCVLPPGVEAAEPEGALSQVFQMPPQVNVPKGRLHPTPSDPPALGKRYGQAWASDPGTLGHCGQVGAGTGIGKEPMPAVPAE